MGDFSSMKKERAQVVFSRKVPFVKEKITFQGKKIDIWKANCTQGDFSFSFFLKKTKGTYKTKDGGKEIGYYLTMTCFDNKPDNR